MPGPWQSPSGIYYLRERVPAGVAFPGESMTFRFRLGDATRAVKARQGGHVKVSLGTRDREEARAAYREASAQLTKQLAAIGKGGVDLTERQVYALAGERYWAILREYGDDPGCPEGWGERVEALLPEALAFFDPPDPEDPRGRERHQPFDPARGKRELERLLASDLDPFLAARGLALSPTSRVALLKAAALAEAQAIRQLQRHAAGDFSADPDAGRFPAWTDPRPSDEAASCPIGDLLDAWAKERKPRPSTERDFRTSVNAFADFAGHRDAERYTARDVIRWKDVLVASGAAPKTINDAKLAALKAVLGYATDNGRLASNVAAGVAAFAKQGAGAKMRGYSDEEAATILSKALSQQRPALRWVPWLCAMTGARVAEICQLRREDVRWEQGVWSIDITPEAGPLKNATSERIVPLHPVLIDIGFLAFVENRPLGPLFLRAGGARKGATAKVGKSLANDIAEWVRSLGLKVGREHRKDPNHAWRHRFTTLARRHHLDAEKREAILGHRLKGEAGTYGDMEGLYAEILKLPAPLSTGGDVDV